VGNRIRDEGAKVFAEMIRNIKREVYIDISKVRNKV